MLYWRNTNSGNKRRKSRSPSISSSSKSTSTTQIPFLPGQNHSQKIWTLSKIFPRKCKRQECWKDWVAWQKVDGTSPPGGSKILTAYPPLLLINWSLPTSMWSWLCSNPISPQWVQGWEEVISWYTSPVDYKTEKTTFGRSKKMADTLIGTLKIQPTFLLQCIPVIISLTSSSRPILLWAMFMQI